MQMEKILKAIRNHLSFLVAIITSILISANLFAAQIKVNEKRKLSNANELKSIELSTIVSKINVELNKSNSLEVILSGTTCDNLYIKDKEGNILQKKTTENSRAVFITKFNENEKCQNNNLKATIKIPKKYNNSLKLSTVSGQININHHSTLDKINAKSVSGEIILVNTSTSRMTLKTVSSNISITKSSASRANFESVSGEIMFSNGNNITNINMTTISGDITAKLASKNKKIRVKTVSGDIDLLCNKNANSMLNYKTISGGIDFDKSIFLATSIKHTNNIQGLIGKTKNINTGNISVKSVSGDLEIKKL